MDQLAGFVHKWLKIEDRDIAELFGRWRHERQRTGMGEVEVIHQRGHPEKRKAREEYDEHDEMNTVVDDKAENIASRVTL